jgi:hypothetical protein
MVSFTLAGWERFKKKKSSKTVTGNIRKIETYNLDRKYQRHLKYILSSIF